jgi:membrane-associated phospholipid phosphatase
MEKSPGLYDWYQLLRQVGSGLMWAVVAGAWWLAGLGVRARVDLPRPERLPVAMVLAVAMAGVAAELLKPLIGRMRPEDTDMLLDEGLWRVAPGGDDWGYAWMPWAQRLKDWSDLGVPSSHAAVAFAGVMVIVLWRPASGLVLIPLACGTAWTRILNANHFLSDTVVGAGLGIVGAMLAYGWCKVGRRE